MEVRLRREIEAAVKATMDEWDAGKLGVVRPPEYHRNSHILVAATEIALVAINDLLGDA